MSDAIEIALVRLQVVGSQDALSAMAQLKSAGEAVAGTTRDQTAALKEQLQALGLLKGLADGVGEAADKIARKNREGAAGARDLGVALETSATSASGLVAMIGKVVLDVGEAQLKLERMAGVKGFQDRVKDVKELESALAKAANSLNMSDDKFEKLVGKDGKIIFDIATKSGMPVEKVLEALIATQNETSKGEQFMGGGGAVMTAAARFATATDAKLADVAPAMGMYADQFGLSEKDMLKLPGMLYMQQLQGSLEAKSMTKFVKTAAPFQALTGKGGLEGFGEMFAVANIIKDKGGTGRGEAGAATASTLMMALMTSLGDPKKLKGVEKALGGKVSANGRVSFDLIMQRLRAAGGNEDKELVDKAAKGDEGAAMKLGNESKLFKDMARLVGNSQARRALTALYASAKGDQGTEKDLKKLARPDVAAGQAAVDMAANRMGSTGQGRDTAEEIRQLQMANESYKGSAAVAAVEAAHREGGRFNAAHPDLALAGELDPTGKGNKARGTWSMVTSRMDDTELGADENQMAQFQRQMAQMSAPTVNVTVNVSADGTAARIVSEQRTTQEAAQGPPRKVNQAGVR